MAKNPKKISPEKKKVYFFMVSAKAVYETDEGIRQRSLNVLMEVSSGQITKHELAQINRSVVARVNAENNVEPSKVKDVILLNIVPLAHCTPEQFHAE